MNFHCQMGDRVRDVVTGFEGIVTGRCEYMTGCNQVLVAPAVDADGRKADSCWFDDDRLEIKVSSAVRLPRHSAPGSDTPAPIR